MQFYVYNIYCRNIHYIKGICIHIKELIVEAGCAIEGSPDITEL